MHPNTRQVALAYTQTNALTSSSDDDTEGCDRGDDVMVGMLGACFTSLSGRNMAGMFVDGVKTSEYDLTSLGKHGELLQSVCVRINAESRIP